MGRPVVGVDRKQSTARAPLPRSRDATRRVVVEHVRPTVDDGRFPVKRTVGEPLRVEADVFTDGHEEVSAFLVWRHDDDEAWCRLAMQSLGNDRFEAVFRPDRLGGYSYRVVGVLDRFTSWAAGIVKKVAAAQEIAVDLEIGARLLERAAARSERALFHEAARALRAGDLGPVDDANIAARMRERASRADVTQTPIYACVIDRERARYSTWYEMFPRSASCDPARHGTFADV